MKIYFISGLGANRKAFDGLVIPQDFEPVFLDWKRPEQNESLEHYTYRMAEKITPNEQFHLVGLSFGGILAQEMNAFLNPEKTILISTIRSRTEMPKYMKLSSKTAIHKAIPMRFFTSDKALSYSFFRNLYDPRMPKLNAYFTEKDPYYLSWSINKIVNWTPKQSDIHNLHRMHGDKDIVFPVNFIKNADIVKNGTHVMIIQKAKAVNNLFHKYLTE
ncbi:alpha/beta hydrolase [Flavobacteriaceae bacterium Ap0902]|nr:alpha/beta hydrolase [Flavobacteriaceae bacterium Ap0902]